MKNMKKIILALIVILGFTAGLYAQTGATSGNATAQATIVSPIAISYDGQALDFSFIAVNANSGTVELTPSVATTATPTGGVTLPITNTPKAARFVVSGQADYTYVVTLPADDAIVITNGTPADDMSLTDFASSVDLGGVLDGSGSQTIYVGAMLHVAGNQTPDDYTGTFTVHVDYD
jgi:hypothetical protein